MDIHLGLFSERLRRLLAGEEGTLPDAAKQHIQNLHTQIEIVTSYLRDSQYDLAWPLVKKSEKTYNMDYQCDRAWILLRNIEETAQIDFSGIEALSGKINCYAHEAEKVIDSFIISIMQQESESCSKEISDTLLALQNKIIDIKQRMQHVQHFSTEIVDEVKSVRNDFDNSPASSGVKKNDTVGLDDKMEELLDVLIEGPPQLSVVAILDSIGFDKTAFAAEAYDSNYVKHYFDCRAWVPMSISYHPDEVLYNILKILMPSSRLNEIRDGSYEMKKNIIRDCLMNKRYLIVLDDVWENKTLYDIRKLLPDNHNGSRVITTLTLTEVLTSFQLENGENIRLDLVPRGPLRVMYQGWHFLILYHGSTSLKENSEETLEKPFALQLFKYCLLPFHLKLCCLYMSVFPIHSEISTRQLYQLWIAEGFIADNNEKTAEDYLEQLISRGLVKTNKRGAGGTIKTCSIPGRWWMALMTVAFRLEFIYSRPMEVHEDKSWKNVNRFTANVNVRDLDTLDSLDSWLHSFFYLSPESDGLNRFKCKKICEMSKLLRVLALESIVLYQYPPGVEDLFLLRYLKLNIPSLRSLPSSLLCNLLNLYTLDMPSSYIDDTADDIWKMNKLRNLNFGLITLPAHPGKYCSSLENLNFISALHPKSCSQDILGRLPNLRILRISGDLSYYQFSLSKSLFRLSCLESLKLVNKCKMPRRSIIILIEYEFPASLTHLSLSNTELMEDPMPILEKLPRLQVLKLKQNSYVGRKLACGPYGFPKLKVLHLKSMLWLEEWDMDIGAMPKLECLMINPCAYLKRLPEQLWCMKSFKKLELWRPLPELRQKLRVIEDKEQYDIQIYPLGM